MQPILTPPTSPLEAAARELGVSCCNQLAIPGFLFNPLGLARARLQLQHQLAGPSPVYSGLINCMASIARTDGVRALWRYGVTMSMTREFFYGGLQWGLYTPLKLRFEAALAPDARRRGDGSSSGAAAAAAGAAVTAAEGGGASSGDGGADSLTAAVGAGLVSGALASWFVAPVDQLMLRAYAEGGVVDGGRGVYATGLRKGHPPSARSYGEMLRQIHAEAGVGGVFRGTTMTVCRAMSITVCLTTGYDQTKRVAKSAFGLREGLLTHALGSLSAGVGASVASAPFDLIKSRLMVAPDRYPGGTLDCLRQTLRAEGVRGLFVGTGAASARLAPATLLYMPLMEQMRYLAGVDYFGVV